MDCHVPTVCLDVVNWFKADGCYVMGGVPTHWRRGIEDSRPGYLDVYHAFDMLSPWMVGRIGDIAGADNFYANVNTPDQAHCDANGVDYQPCVLPGDLQSGHRAHGDFMWRQFYNMCRIGVQGIYISMFDEFNEGNQIAKTAETAAQVPVGSGIRALDEDGTACSADYYLRLTGDGGRMLKGELALTATRPTPPVVGGGGPNPARVFDPSSGNTVTVTFASAASVRYVRVQITANTGWPAGQFSGLSVHADRVVLGGPDPRTTPGPGRPGADARQDLRDISDTP
ncbi:hypothetical protein SSPS47_01380 [Streptomyces sp. S4.7]|nr:hypothetical protein SSPS47_01380 [Streptomyces sp. S4.7]